MCQCIYKVIIQHSFLFSVQRKYSSPNYTGFNSNMLSAYYLKYGNTNQGCGSFNFFYINDVFLRFSNGLVFHCLGGNYFLINQNMY